MQTNPTGSARINVGQRLGRAVPVVLGILFLACASAQMVETRGGSRYAPVNERRGGRVKYLTDGIADIVTARREDAYQQMHDVCGGNYEIVSEWDQAGETITSVHGNTRTSASAYGNSNPYGWNAYGSSNTQGSAMAISGTQTYRNIEFLCLGVPRKPATGNSARRALLPSSTRVDPVAAPPNSKRPEAQNGGSIEKALAPKPAPKVTALELAAFLSLETGCSESEIKHVSSRGPAHRLDACGHAYLCVEATPVPVCRFALSEQNDGG